jgi:hypothetical protein
MKPLNNPRESLLGLELLQSSFMADSIINREWNSFYKLEEDFANFESKAR